MDRRYLRSPAGSHEPLLEVTSESGSHPVCEFKECERVHEATLDCPRETGVEVMYQPALRYFKEAWGGSRWLASSTE